MFCHHAGKDAAPHPKFCGESGEAGRGRGYDVVENFVGHRLVELALIAERPNIELETFQFYAALVRNVIEIKRCEVGLTSLWA